MLASLRFPGAALVVAAAVFAAMHAVGNDYVFYAGYTVLQYVVLAVSWNILGGYVGYVNFGVASFVALGALHGSIAFEGRSPQGLRENDLVRRLYLGQ